MGFSRTTNNFHAPSSYAGSRNRQPAARACDGSQAHNGRTLFREPTPFSQPRRGEQSRATHGHEASRTRGSTYGTYILPIEAQGQYRTLDPTRCGCNCCPHPRSTSRSHDDHRRMETPNLRSSLRPSSGGSRRSSQPRERTSGSTSSIPNFSRKLKSRYLIDVVDRSNGSLNRQYAISLYPHSTSASVEAFLVPDRRLAKAVVHWDNGQMEPLGSGIPVQELLRHADYLEVKRKKRVHWA